MHRWDGRRPPDGPTRVVGLLRGWGGRLLQRRKGLIGGRRSFADRALRRGLDRGGGGTRARRHRPFLRRLGAGRNGDSGPGWRNRGEARGHGLLVGLLTRRAAAHAGYPAAGWAPRR